MSFNFLPSAAQNWASKICNCIVRKRSGTSLRTPIFGKLVFCCSLAGCIENSSTILPELYYPEMSWRLESEWFETNSDTGFRLYASQAADSESFGCHGCAPQLAIVKIEREWAGWRESQPVRNLGAWGGWGRLPGYQFSRIREEPYFIIHSGFSSGGTSEVIHAFYSLNNTIRTDTLMDPMLSIHTIESAEGGFGWRHLPDQVQQTIEEAGCEISTGLLGYYRAQENLEIDSKTGLISCQMVDRKCGAEPPCPIEGVQEEGVVWELEDTPVQHVQLPCKPQAVTLSTGIAHWSE